MKYAASIYPPVLLAAGLCIATTSTTALAQTEALAPVPAAASAAPAAVPHAVPAVTAPLFATAPASSAVVRIGVLSTKGSGDGQNAQAMGEETKMLLNQYLTTPTIEAVAISTAVPDAATAEAKQKNCSYVLESSIQQKKAGGVGMTGGMANMIGASAAGTALGQASAMNGLVHARTTYTFAYKLTALGSGAAALSNSEVAKSQKDGEEVVSPLLHYAPEAVLTVIGVK